MPWTLCSVMNLVLMVLRHGLLSTQHAWVQNVLYQLTPGHRSNNENNSFLNAVQVAVMACDWPIFAIVQQIKWNHLESPGKDKFQVMFGVGGGGGLTPEERIMGWLWWPTRVVVSTAAFHARVRGSVPGLGGLKETKIVSSPSTCESQYCGEPPWPRGSVLGLRPPGLEFRILCLEDSVISIISPSSGGYPGPV